MNPFAAIDDIRMRTAEAVVAQSGLDHTGLAAHLRAILASSDASAGAMVREPLLEGAYPYVAAPETFGELSGNLLEPRLVAALAGEDTARKRDYVFRRDAHPFRHQIDAWKTLLSPVPKSVLVTSGTGSGKTECFFVPILNDLARRAGREEISGVEAIMLYPLNALIESQRQRLEEWTAPFNGQVRYALYNSNLPNEVSSRDALATPWEVVDRRSLRASPPPILVTNITMLEYMLIRGADRPILNASRGRLKWIVLDEAHSLVGAAAAEIALLLRRVMLAFGVEREQVRFVATSATIGSGDGATALGKFLADVAGISPEQVTVIEGHRRRPPPRSTVTADGTGRRYNELAADPDIEALVRRLFDGIIPMEQFRRIADRRGQDPAALATELATTRSVSESGAPGDLLAPLRVHAFHRAMPGLWSCVSPECQGRPQNWQFGQVLTEQVEKCPSCGSLVLEIQSCSACGIPALVGYEQGGRLRADRSLPPEDEFQDDARREADTEGDDDEAMPAPTSSMVLPILLLSNPTTRAYRMTIDRTTGFERDSDEDGALRLAYDELQGGACPCCLASPRSGQAFRPFRFGAPFLMGNATPLLLSRMSPEPAELQPLPSGGRRLLSFTDSRQGTARISAKLQIESERNFVRSFVYHAVQGATRPPEGNDAAVAELQALLAVLRPLLPSNPAIANEVRKKEQDLARMIQGAADGLEWRDLVNGLAEAVEVSDWISKVWLPREPNFSDPTALAEFLLLREFARRPQKANSLETLGLARLISPRIDTLTPSSLPQPFAQRGKTLTDWREYLYFVLTHFVRANGAIGIDAWMQHWISPKASLKRLAGPNETPDRTRDILHWPSAARSSGRSRPILALVAGLGLDPKSPADASDIDDCLQQAFNQLRPVLTRPASANLALSFRELRVAPVVEAHWCPITRRPLSEVAFGLSPFGLAGPGRQVDAVRYPSLPTAVSRRDEIAPKSDTILQWLKESKEIQVLRDRGAWTDISDRIAAYSDYARAAEHSAQQESATLRNYEEQFREGRINILNCSTTMEMGVDIGSVAAVTMTNVPPHVANYRQRVGRAGRRGQPLSLAYTFCKDRPLDRSAYRDPESFLQRKISPPKVALDSRPIVQRHVNAYLLSQFIAESSGEALAMTAGSFFGCPPDVRTSRPVLVDRPADQFLQWLRAPSTHSRHDSAIAAIVASSILAGDRGLYESTFQEMDRARLEYVADWESLKQQVQSEALEQQTAKTALSIEMQRLAGDFLLGALSERGYLPGHGFPTDVVSFQTGARSKPASDYQLTRENRFRTRGGPQRSLDLAIRDYAPGAEVVVDGLVYTSAGVTLNWKKPATDESVRELQSLRTQWSCPECGASGIDPGGAPDHCPTCGNMVLGLTKFLRPAGFSVDGRAKPHNQIDEVVFIKAQEPEVTTRDALWVGLPEPRLGRQRASRDGLVFYSSLGAHSEGYAVCLHCGRSGAEVASDGPLPHSLEQHYPLRGRSANSDGRCTGNDSSFAIQRHLALGHEISTDVFELQPVAPIAQAAANALVIALREAVGLKLGVEAQDMGFATSARKSQLGGKATSLLLFDRAAGGAGFSSSVPQQLHDILAITRQILDCPVVGCESGCPACVLVSDAPDGRDALDRKAALQYLDEHLAFGALLLAEDCFVPEARRSISLLDEVMADLSGQADARLRVWLSSLPAEGGFGEWPMASVIKEAVYHGRRVEVIFPAASVDDADAATLLALRDFAVETGAQLCSGSAPIFPNGAVAVCAVDGRGTEPIFWATRGVGATTPSASWGHPDVHPIAVGGATVSADSQSVGLERLVPPKGAQYREITDELDGRVQEFGGAAASVLSDLLRRRGVPVGVKLRAVTYQDPYVTSPLVARLLVDTLQCISKSQDKVTVVIETTAAGSRYRDTGNPFDISHDWRDQRVQKDTVEAYASLRGLDLKLLHRSVPHGRFLRLTFTDGTVRQIVLDQGFGPWRPPAGVRNRYDFSLAADQQAKRLAAASFVVARSGIGASYLVAT